MSNFLFQPIDDSIIKQFLSERANEKRIGQCVNLGLVNSANYALLAIKEDIGPQTNLGRPGARRAFESFLSKFLNMQSNEFCSGDQLSLYGIISQNLSFSSQEEGFLLVEELDEMVEHHIQKIIQHGKIPIIIGGGHNNAYPIIRGHFQLNRTSMDIVNLDAHADTRALEGRHSGNPFSYAITDGYINQYSVLGLHKPYNSQYILDFLHNNKCRFQFFEDYISEKQSFVSDLIAITSENPQIELGIELDMDCIAYMPSSAMGPCGFSIEQARYFIRHFKQSNRKISYLHLPEAAPENEQQANITGKALAYLVYDFIRPQ